MNSKFSSNLSDKSNAPVTFASGLGASANHGKIVADVA
jgi:hypothetical protein